MDTTSKQINWHYETLPVYTKKAFDFLSGQNWISDNGWYLAGGTALALQAGNRKSVDLDFFTSQQNFENDSIIDHLSTAGKLLIDVNKERTVYVTFLDAKISFISYPFFIPQEPFISHSNIRVLDKKDIAVMKIVAISQRGKKRDFFDLYWCAKNIMSLEEIIQRLPKQYPSVAHDYHHILKSLVYFDDAEHDPEPEIFFDADWKKVKSFFTKEIPILTKRIIKLE